MCGWSAGRGWERGRLKADTPTLRGCSPVGPSRSGWTPPLPKQSGLLGAVPLLPWLWEKEMPSQPRGRAGQQEGRTPALGPFHLESWPFSPTGRKEAAPDPRLALRSLGALPVPAPAGPLLPEPQLGETGR